MVEAAWRRVQAEPEAARRLALWSSAAVELWQAELEAAGEPRPSPPQLYRWDTSMRAYAAAAVRTLRSGPAGERLLATAGLLACAGSVSDRDGWGLSAVLSAASPDGERAWASGVVLDRPPRFFLRSVREGGDLCLWSDLWGEDERWDAYVAPYALPVPLSLADRYADLAARERELSDEGNYPEEHRSELERTWRESQELLPRFRAALGPAYRIR